jgi:large subunit ribosomal protein L18
MANTSNIQKRTRRHARIRAKVFGTAERPRLCVFKSNTSLEVQLINDDLGTTIAYAKGKDATKVGADIAAKGKKAGVETVVFDRGGFIYTGKVKQLAESAREAGLKF